MKKKAAKKKKAQSRALVIQSPADPSLKIAVASELADDEMIEREMQGEILPHFVYQFPQEGKDVVGLTVKGVNEVVRRLNRNPKSGSKIRVRPDLLKIEQVEQNGEKGVMVTVFAEDLVTGNSAFGIKFEPYTKRGKRGPYENTFALEKALSKAERNAKRKLLPEVLAANMISKMIKESPNNVRRLDAPREPEEPRMTPQQAVEQLKNIIKNLKKDSALIELDKKIAGSTIYTDSQKEELRHLISLRIDELRSK